MVQVRGRRRKAVLRPRPRPASPRPPGHVRVYIVRHAEAGEKDKWTGPDQLRPLTEAGWKQAHAIAEILEGVEQLRSSRYLRCRQTLEPLAERLGLEIENEDRLVEGTPFPEVLGLIAETRAAATMSTHGDVVEALVAHLLGHGLTQPTQAGSSKGSTWALDVVGGRIGSAFYIPPPHQSGPC